MTRNLEIAKEGVLARVSTGVGKAWAGRGQSRIFRKKINGYGGPGGCLENKQNQLVSERWDRAAFKSVSMPSDVFVPLAAFVPASSPYKHLAQFAVDEGNRISIASSKWKVAVTQGANAQRRRLERLAWGRNRSVLYRGELGG